MPLILNIETATDTCSICISHGDQILAFRESDRKYDHAARITILLEKALEDAQVQLKEIDAVALSQGPGSFTSLRVGASTAKGICYTLDKPLIAVDTLQSIALATHQKFQKKEALFAPMIDARRMEVYTAIFKSDGSRVAKTSALVVKPESFDPYLKAGKEIVFSGNGAEKCKAVLQNSAFHFVDVVCSAEHMVSIAHRLYQTGSFSEAAYYTPFYLKPPNITKPKKIF